MSRSLASWGGAVLVSHLAWICAGSRGHLGGPKAQVLRRGSHLGGHLGSSWGLSWGSPRLYWKRLAWEIEKRSSYRYLRVGIESARWIRWQVVANLEEFGRMCMFVLYTADFVEFDFSHLLALLTIWRRIQSLRAVHQAWDLGVGWPRRETL